MLKESFGVASTVDEARKIAVANLHAPIDADVKVEVVTYPKKKILGLFGGADAKVRASYDDGVSEKKAAPIAATPKSEKKAAPAKETKKNPEKKPQPKKEVQKKETVKKETPEKKVSEKKSVSEVDFASLEPIECAAADYLKSILVGMGYEDITVTAKESEEDVYIEISGGDDCGNIIGRRGETLDALQYLTRLYLNHDDNNGKRVTLNVGDYRKRREETLIGLAKRQAARVAKYGRSVALDPMNPYERRIIHTAIQDVEGVTSYSVGDGDRRRVVIASENGDRRNYRDNRRGSYREKRAPYVPEMPKEPREQKVDAATSSRYGKIEPKNKTEE